MERDPDHPIIDRPWEWTIGALHYDAGADGNESYVDLDLLRGEVVRRLRFWSPQEFQIEPGFPQPTGGMAILDVRWRGLEGLAVQVTDFEASQGAIRFWARAVVDRDRLETS